MDSTLTNKSFKWSAATAAIVIVSYIVTWHLYAMWWFILVFVDFAVLLLWVIIALKSIIFWIRNRKMVHLPYIPVCTHVLTALCLTFSPSIYRNKTYPKYTFSICNRINNNCSCNLAIEMYTVFKGGTGETDSNSVYITDDRKNFRKYIGVCDERNKQIEFRCDGDYIISTKKSSEGLNTYWIALKVLEQKRFNLKELKDSHHFD